jgi:hypothetical protein
MLFQVDGEPMHSVKFEDLLKIVGSNTAVLKMDIEGYECKVGKCFYTLSRVSFETSFDSKQPKLEPKLVSGITRNKTFVSVVSLLYRNRDFQCFA